MPNLSLERPGPVPFQSSHYESDDEDVYRGSPPPPSIHSLSRIDTRTSSSSSISFPGRAAIGAFANVVENAVARWAKNIARGHSSSSSTTSSSSSSSTSSSSSALSGFTLARSFSRRRKKRRNSTTKSEAEITAAIKALHESRQVPRLFSLYLPPSLAGKRREGITWTDAKQLTEQHVHDTQDLTDVLERLDAALKKTSKARKAGIKRAKTPDVCTNVTDPSFYHDYMLSSGPSTRPASSSELTDTIGKGKGKQSATPIFTQSSQAWWLDVSSPTWQDLRAIGKLLHLHPLTLEDILHQDPREKLESFQRLGYYFISFRAVSGSKARQTLRRAEDTRDFLQGKGWYAERTLETQDIGEANIYLVVFREGICSFHFTDMTEHTERVRKRLSSLQVSESLSSDWIAHNILDSVVDAFFPFLDEIEKEVLNIEDVVFSDGSFWGATSDVNNSEETLAESPEDKCSVNEKMPSPVMEYCEKTGLDETKECRSLLEASHSVPSCLPKITIPPVFRPFNRVIYKRSKKAKTSSSQNPDNSTYSMLLRMARTRRLVTSLARLLTAKADIISHVQKRLLNSAESPEKGKKSTSKVTNSEEQEVAIYMGDIQDHIYTLHNSLVHYERMLSESHPTYLTRLSVVQARTKSGGDKAILFLSIISIGVLCGQTTIGCFSMNILIPSNDTGKYNVFGVVISLLVIVLSAYLSLLRYWWKRSKRKRSTAL